MFKDFQKYFIKAKCFFLFPATVLKIVYYCVVSIEFSPLSTVELSTNWYQLHNGDYREI